jgi:hypothetical protein
MSKMGPSCSEASLETPMIPRQSVGQSTGQRAGLAAGHRAATHRSRATIAGLLALALAFSASAARAQDDDDDDGQASPPIVVSINGPCALMVDGKDVPCRAVAYMVFPSNHRIDFAAITDNAGFAFSGEDDQNHDGQYALDVDSVVAPSAGRVDAEGECDMTIAEDKRTVKSLSCRATTDQGVMTLRASGAITAGDSDDDDDGD